MLDRMTPPKYSQFLSERVADSRLHLIEGAGHMVMLEKPNEVNNIMKDFLEMR
jgi:pimeloyl-ACP methyl ester carboxylesterase